MEGTTPVARRLKNQQPAMQSIIFPFERFSHPWSTIPLPGAARLVRSPNNGSTIMLTALSGWLHAFRIYTHPRVLGMLSLGFSAGLPLLLVMGTLSFWLREAGIDRSTIGHLSWIGLAYGIKWMWSPLVDRLRLPLLTRLLGRRRAWLLLSQVIISAAWPAWPPMILSRI